MDRLFAAYRNGEYSPSKHLDNIEDTGIRELLASMIEKNPANRKTAELYLSHTRNKVFPEYFYGFLQSYMQIFSAAPILSPDEKISRLKKDIGNITCMFKSKKEEQDSEDTKTKSDVVPELTKEDSGQCEDNTTIESLSDQHLNKIELGIKEAPKLDSMSSSTCEKQEESEAALKDKSEKLSVDDEEGLVIITQLVTSCIRGLHHAQSKLQCLEILLELAENTSDETILDRILPYIVS